MSFAKPSCPDEPNLITKTSDEIEVHDVTSKLPKPCWGSGGRKETPAQRMAAWPWSELGDWRTV